MPYVLPSLRRERSFHATHRAPYRIPHPTPFHFTPSISHIDHKFIRRKGTKLTGLTTDIKHRTSSIDIKH
jgi:hypothetical protein